MQQYGSAKDINDDKTRPSCRKTSSIVFCYGIRVFTHVYDKCAEYRGMQQNVRVKDINDGKTRPSCRKS